MAADLIAEIKTNKFTLSGLSRINVLLGRNGCGKSTMLQSIDQEQLDQFTRKRYISPERAGSLLYNPTIDGNIRSNDGWLSNDRRKNQTPNFKIQSASNFMNLRMKVLHRFHDTMLQQDRLDPILESLNSLLDNIEFQLTDTDFEFVSRTSKEKIPSSKISSGESELAALAIEVIDFCHSAKTTKSILLLDEPDVHIHPDLQKRFISFLFKQLQDTACQVILCTHSTAIVSALSALNGANIAFMRPQQNDISFNPISDSFGKIVPIFGAHPLTQVFNDDPPIIVEGEDDERIWVTVVRSAQGKVRLFPVVAGDKCKLTQLEREVLSILPAIYENPKCFSLRDGDGNDGVLAHDDFLNRYRLGCYAAENLLLTDDVIERQNLTWEALKVKLQDWLHRNSEHPKYESMKSFESTSFNRKTANIKDLRLIIIDLLNETKPWEVVVGQAIAQCVVKRLFQDSEFSLKEALGWDFITNVLLNDRT